MDKILVQGWVSGSDLPGDLAAQSRHEVVAKLGFKREPAVQRAVENLNFVEVSIPRRPGETWIFVHLHRIALLGRGSARCLEKLLD